MVRPGAGPAERAPAAPPPAARRTRLHVRLLGPLSATVDSRSVTAAGAPRRAVDLVALLAIAPRHRLSRDHVVETLWSHLGPEAGVANLHRAASHARKMLGDPDAVVLHGGLVLLWPDAEITTDVEDFEAAADAALRAGDRGAAAEVAARYGEGLLPADPNSAWLAAPRDRLRRRYLDVLRCAGHWAELVCRDPADEDAHRRHVGALAAAGRRYEAMQECDRLRAALAELSLLPSPESVRLWSTLALPATTQVLPHRPPLVGRAAELGRACAVLDRAAKGSGGALLVAGEVGIGKTRFCEALLDEAAGRGWTIAHGGTNRAEGAAPFAALTEAIGRLLRQRPDLDAALPSPAREGLDRLFGRAEPSLSETGLRGRQPILSAVLAVLAVAASARGAMLLLDDLHEADIATVQLAHYLGRATRYEPIVVVLAYRREQLVPAAAQVRASLLAGQGACEIGLGPLSAQACAAVVRRVAGDSVPDAAAARIHELAEGNPFFTEELAAAVRPEGALHIPRRVYEIIEARVGALEPRVRRVLQRIAVAGVRFTADEVVALTGLAEPEALAVLGTALRVGLVVEAGAAFRFRHPLLRAAVLASLPEAQRRSAHRRAAAMLIAHGAPPGRIGHHLVAAGAGTDAVPWLERAAHDATAVGAVADARALVEQALAFAPGRSSLLELRADCLFACGEPSTLAAFSEAIAAAHGRRRRALRIRQARAAVVLGDADTAAAALAGLRPTSTIERLRLRIAEGYLALARGEVTAARRHASEARRLALAGGLVAELADAASLCALVAHTAGEWQHQIEADLLDTSRAPQLAASVHDGHLCVVEHYLYGEQPDERLIAFARRLRDTARHNGAERGEAFATLVLGEAALLAGRGGDAVAYLSEAARLHQRVGSAAGEALALQRLAEGSLEADPTAVVEPLLLAREASLLVRHLLPRIYGTLIRAAATTDDALAVIAEAEASTVEAREHCRTCAVAFAVPAVLACVAAGLPDRARGYLHSAREHLPPTSRTDVRVAAVAGAEAALAAAEAGRPGMTGRFRGGSRSTVRRVPARS